MTPTPEPDFAARIDALGERLDEATDAAHVATRTSQDAIGEMRHLIEQGDATNVARWTRYSKRTRRIVYGIIVSLLADFSIYILVFHNQHIVTRLAHKAASEHTSLVIQCEANNQFRADDKKLWDKVEELSNPPGNVQTPEQQQTTAAFNAFLDQHDAPRDCTKIP